MFSSYWTKDTACLIWKLSQLTLCREIVFLLQSYGVHKDSVSKVQSWWYMHYLPGMVGWAVSRSDLRDAKFPWRVCEIYLVLYYSSCESLLSIHSHSCKQPVVRVTWFVTCRGLALTYRAYTIRQRFHPLLSRCLAFKTILPVLWCRILCVLKVYL